eukprot:CAMPEP_0115029208 /NCGR_PEP_ID=MMETSP0216-20121206/36839_1 /TAXON_ID=223996 /ORGANISM="Protocruzia adherens, Strain Boccale" /LENGTH=1045 /DNA_ID=CAMNT_0002405699 /DNA_START=269 /DNA_END=3406 /DNA_ORIENTATION=-
MTTLGSTNGGGSSASAGSGSTANSTSKPLSYVGLSNQGATCYMNSLLQTLFMTPEFRKCLYSWSYDAKKHQGQEDCIPLQLQKLFAELQTKAERNYVETRALTKSFQWDFRQGFEQHDVQEFCRVLFDAIETSCKGTSQENFINELYEGLMVDYVQCKECNYESKREDKFLDLSLTIKNPFEGIHNDSVPKALENYLKPEILEGGNQYHCEKCDKKVDAIKGLKFKRFPDILTLQLKRFALNYETMHRIKLNDFVSFPAVLNLNPYVKGYDHITGKTDQDTPMSGENGEEGSPIKLRRKLSDSVSDIDLRSIGWVKKDAKTDDIASRDESLKSYVKSCLREGEFVYELYSIMIHAGSAMGGHYYAYIESFEDRNWYSFNDSTVKKIAINEIPNVFGGKKTAGSMMVDNATNAYLLMYRKIKPDNVDRIDDSEIPEYIGDMVRADLEKEEQERKAREERLNEMEIHVYLQGKDKVIKTKRNHTLKDLLELTYKAFELDNGIENCRLRYYNVHANLLQETYDKKEGDTLQALRIYSYTSLGLETKSAGEEWRPHDPNAFQIKVMNWDESIAQSDNLEDEVNRNSKIIEIKRSSSMKDLVERVSQACDIPREKLVILRKNASYDRKLVDVLNTSDVLDRPLHLARVYDGVNLFVEAHEEGSDVRIKDSKSRYGLQWEGQFEIQNNKIVLKINSPDKGDTGSIPEYDIKITIDNRETARQLKEKIAKKINIEADQFLFKRGGRTGVEIKDLEQKISQINLYQNAVVYIERGCPTKQGERRLMLYSVTEDLTSESEIISSKFTELFELPLNENYTLPEAKEAIAKAVNQKRGEKLEHFRIREKTSDKLGKVFKDGEKLKDLSLYERKSFALQTIKEAETLPKDHLVFLAAYVDTSTWKFGKRVEVVIPKTGTLQEFGEKLAKGLDVPLENLLVMRLISTYSFSMHDLQTAQWVKLEGNKNSLCGTPWYLSYDGVLFIVKDATITSKPLKAADRTSALTSWSHNSSSGYRGGRRQEKGLKITVKEREDDAEGDSNSSGSNGQGNDVKMSDQ